MKIKQQIQNGWPFFETDKELVIFSRSKNHLVTPTDRMVDREISPVCSPPAITVPRIPWMTHQKWTWKTCKKRMIPVKIYVRSKSSNYAFQKKWCQKIGVHLKSLVVEFLVKLTQRGSNSTPKASSKSGAAKRAAPSPPWPGTKPPGIPCCQPFRWSCCVVKV